MTEERPVAQYEGWEWWWACPLCEEGHAAEFDIRNSTLTCPSCGGKSYVGNHDDLPEATDNDIRYKFECPACGEMNWTEEDCRGSNLTCDVCRVDVTVSN